VGGSALIDTNVLVYATGIDGPEKGERARATLEEMAVRGAGVVSTQALSEYSRAMLRRTPRSEYADIARDVAVLSQTWPLLTVTGAAVVDAIRGTIEHGMSFYDAQLWATARLAGVDVILTEDFADGRVVEGVRFVDPFAPSFDPRRPPF
jgi:predicted nucleic acid-binding protein